MQQAIQSVSPRARQPIHSPVPETRAPTKFESFPVVNPKARQPISRPPLRTSRPPPPPPPPRPKPVQEVVYEEPLHPVHHPVEQTLQLEAHPGYQGSLPVPDININVVAQAQEQCIDKIEYVEEIVYDEEIECHHRYKYFLIYWETIKNS